MLPTFVIGLREGLEAALIVGIIAAFLRKQGRRDLLRWVFLGVGVAIVLCVAAGVALDVLSHDLPQKQQEGLETVVGALAVAMVSYMVVWMKRNSRQLKGHLEGLAADAMGGASGAARAMILMAFLAVLREGVETVVFLLAAFNQSTSGTSAAVGACLGLAVAIALGYGIYRGGVRINLSKFFRATGLVLVLVAAGILVNALHTAHEAGWLDAGQQRTIDLSWLVDPGSVQASLLTGMLGLQPHPVLIELIGWLIYVVPVGLYVAWAPGRAPLVSRRTVTRSVTALGAAVGIVAIVLAVVRPDSPSGSGAASDRTAGLKAAGSVRVDGLTLDRYAGSAEPVDGGTARMPFDRIAQLNGGRLPIGVRQVGTGATVRYDVTARTTALVEPRTATLISVQTVRTTAASVRTAIGSLPLSQPVRADTSGTTAAERAAALGAARAALADLDRRDTLGRLAGTFGVLAVLLLAAGGLTAWRTRRASRPADSARHEELVRLGSPN